MNKRIKELKMQACKWASENAPSTEYENAADQKFAELLIQECSEVCENSNYEFGTIFAKMIKQHFGLK